MQEGEKINITAEEEPAERKINIKDYKDLEGVSLEKLSFGFWFVKNRQKMIYGIYGILILISAFTWGNFLFNFGYYLVIGMARDREITNEMVSGGAVGHDYIKEKSAQDLIVRAVTVLRNDDGKYDFAVEVENKNQNYVGNFTYAFSAGSNVYGPETGFILPGESKYLFSLGNELPAGAGSVKFAVQEMSWSRINRHKYPDWNDFYASRTDIAIENQEFIISNQSSLSEKMNINNLKFTIDNRTAFNYWNVDLSLLLYNDDRLAGVGRHQVSRLMSGEKRDIDISWPGNIGRINRIEIMPEVDILDEGNYIDFKGEGGNNFF